MIAKRTKIIGIMLTGIAVFNLIANLMLVPVLGIYGAALSSLVSQMIFFILVLVYAQKYYPIPYRLERVALIIFWGAILFIAGSLFNDRSLIIRIIIKSSALILFPVLLIASRVLDRSEIDYAVSFILNLKNIFISSKKEELEEKMTRIDEAEL
jgi:O-antigen/teichoic acid export membrane protein